MYEQSEELGLRKLFPEDVWRAKRTVLAGKMGKFFTKMDRAIDETMQDGIERGFVVCDETVRECVGDSCQIILPRCKNSKFHGNFHTHPTGSAEFSIGDIAAAFAKDVDVTCVGSREDFVFGEVDAEGNVVKCMVINRSHPEYGRVKRKVLELYYKKYRPIKDYLFEKYRRGDEIEDEYREKYFEIKKELLDLIRDVTDFVRPIGCSGRDASYRLVRLKI